MNALQLLKERELRVQLRNSSKKAVARGSESGDYTSLHISLPSSWRKRMLLQLS